jgi:hypothetical protein
LIPGGDFDGGAFESSILLGRSEAAEWSGLGQCGGGEGENDDGDFHKTKAAVSRPNKKQASALKL